ncbi:hypothetical protein C8R43DRAFT_1088159 [Mycena crocata]|nr:hypothetical protein C8R43DRAFT_1088159 [Mycena crocata]
MVRTSKIKQDSSPKKKPGRKKAPTAKLDELEKNKLKARSDFTQAPRTKGNYEGHVARGHAFLADVVAQRREKARTEPGWVCPQGIDTDILAKAFQNPPNKHSAWALELFLTQKCIVEGLSKSTCDGVHGAFAHLWDNMDGDKFAGPYHLDEETGIVTGCPARAQIIQSFTKVVKTKSNQKGAAATRHHAEAMSIEDMRQWTRWSESKWPRCEVDQTVNVGSHDQLHEKLKHFMMRAFGTSGFVLWTRNFELCGLQMRDLTLDRVGPMPFNLPFFEVFLDNRKGWQNKQGFEHESRESNRYNIYEQPDTPEIDMHSHLLAWLKLYEANIGRKLESEDYVFPYIAPNGERLQDLINEFSLGAGLTKSYTTHSFRRGGAQYRFMFAPLGKRWSLSIVRWWGGWAVGEQVDTLMRYLMDSLQSYETGHGDALCPIPKEADKSFMGEHLLVKPVAAEEFRLVTTQLLTAVRDINLGNRSGNHVQPVQPTGSFCAIQNPIPRSAAQSHSNTLPVNSSTSQPNNSDAATQQIPLANQIRIIPGVFIPDLKKGPTAWLDAVQQWEVGIPASKIPALRDWQKDWYTGGMRLVTGTKRSQRKLIAEEYYRLGCDQEAFTNTYPEAHKRIGALLKAIQKTNKTHGFSLGRRSKRGISSDSD